MAKSLRQSTHSSEAWRDPFEPAHTLPLWLSLWAWAHGMTRPAISNFTCSPTLPFSPSLFSPLGKLLLETWLSRHLLRVASQHSWSGLPHSSAFPWQLGSTCLLQGGLNKSEWAFGLLSCWMPNCESRGCSSYTSVYPLMYPTWDTLSQNVCLGNKQPADLSKWVTSTISLTHNMGVWVCLVTSLK